MSFLDRLSVRLAYDLDVDVSELYRAIPLSLVAVLVGFVACVVGLGMGNG